MLLLPGLGDALAAGPILRGLTRDGWTIDVMTMHAPVSEYVRTLGISRRIVELPTHFTMAQLASGILRLRTKPYGDCILPFPATRWQYAMVARAAGARRLWLHEYGGAASIIARTSRNVRVPLRGGHRLAENLRLARAMGLSGGDDDLVYWMPNAWRASRIAGTLGVHPGSMAYKGNEAKRWPYERFVALARVQAGKGRSVRFFLGPHETREATRARDDFENEQRVEVVSRPLGEAARALAQCEVFVGNDAGFSHLAAGLGVKTLALYGMTSEVRGAPIGAAVAMRPSLCPACHDEGSHGFECVRRIGYRCIVEDIGFDAVCKQVDALFTVPTVEQHLALEGPFRLYGKAYA